MSDIKLFKECKTLLLECKVLESGNLVRIFLQNTDQLKNRIKINNILSFMMLSAEQYKIILSISAFTLY